jgi:site-specific DNA recombinase
LALDTLVNLHTGMNSSLEVTENEATRVLSGFGDVWDSLSPCERNRVIELLVERVDFDGPDQSLSITFRPSGIRVLEEVVA